MFRTASDAEQCESLMRWCAGWRSAASIENILTVIGVTINVGCGVLVFGFDFSGRESFLIVAQSICSTATSPAFRQVTRFGFSIRRSTVFFPG